MKIKFLINYEVVRYKHGVSGKNLLYKNEEYEINAIYQYTNEGWKDDKIILEEKIYLKTGNYNLPLNDIVNLVKLGLCKIID